MKKSVFVYIRIWQKIFEASLEHTSIFLAFLAKICSEFEENSNTCMNTSSIKRSCIELSGLGPYFNEKSYRRKRKVVVFT